MTALVLGLALAGLASAVLRRFNVVVR